MIQPPPLPLRQRQIHGKVQMKPWNGSILAIDQCHLCWLRSENACIHQVCIHSAVVIQPPSLLTNKSSQQGTDGALEWIRLLPLINAIFADLGQKCLHLSDMHTLSECDTTSYPYSEGKITTKEMSILWYLENTKVNYFRWLWYHLSRVDECSDAVICCIIQSASRNINRISLLQLCSQRRELLKWWLYLQHLPIFSNTYLGFIFKSCCGKHQIVIILQMSQDISQTLGRSFEMKFLYCHCWRRFCSGWVTWSDSVSVQSKGKKFSSEACWCHNQHLACNAICNYYGRQGCLNLSLQ